MLHLSIQVNKITVIRGLGTDKIRFHVEAASPFPAAGYGPTFDVETVAKGAEAWLRAIGLEVRQSKEYGRYCIENKTRGETYSAEFEVINRSDPV